METSFTGKRNKRGDWQPDGRLNYPAVFVWPPKPKAIFAWLFGYPGFLLPFGLIYMAIPILTWNFLTPPLATMRHFAPGWVSYILFRNLIMVLAVVGAWHIWLHVRRGQGTDWKYSSKWLARDNPIFLFRNQLLDNLFWTVVSAVPIWSAYEIITWWMVANHYIPNIAFAAHPIYCVVLLLLVPLIRDVHFYAIHRLIHWGPFYRWVHYLHHNNVNIGPASGLAMHPIEHLLYFSGILIHWIIPSNPVHMLFHVQHAALSPAQGHAGFETVVLSEKLAFKTGDYFHYLHHRYFECNYGADGPVPLDKWFGSFHDGSDEAQEAMDSRFLARAKQKAAALEPGA